MSARRLSMWAVGALCVAVVGVAPVYAAAAELPDGRVYELVTPPENNFASEVYQPVAGEEYTNTETEYPFQAAADGSRVAFVGGGTAGGNEALGHARGNEYVAIRSSGGGWQQVNVTPPEAPTAVYEAFSSDLTTGFLESLQPLTPLAPGFGEATQPFVDNYDTLYSTALGGSGEYVPFFTVKPPYRDKLEFRTAGRVRYAGGNGRTLAFAGASADLSHLLFMANDALTGASEGRPAAEGGAASSFEGKDNLYEVVNGALRLVNVLPDGTTHAGATFGNSSPFSAGRVRFSRVVSADGSRIFWTDISSGHIYVRENGAATVEISPAGEYQTASSDGSQVFYINGDLYKYELQGAQTTDLTPGVPVEMVVGTSEDGKYVYYVTKSHELKLWHEGVTTTIAATTVGTSEVTSDGHSVLFWSKSVGENSGHASIYAYDADTATLYCVSCTAGGKNGVLSTNNKANVYQPRWMSSDGSRVFFISDEALVPQDVNGSLDVYEWERPGSGGCTQSGGCVYLLSGGTSSDNSYFIDAGENGDDAFISTRAKLLGTDDNELFDIYDVRVDGVVPVTPPACTGTGCQGIPSAPPIFATPSSATFEGVGNFAAPAKEVSAKPKSKKNKKPKHAKKPRRARAKKAKKSARRASRRPRSISEGGR